MTNKLNLMAAAWGLTVLLPAQADAQLQTRRGFEIGTELFDYEYRERSEGQVIASDTGSFPGITASFVAGLGKGYLFRTRFSADFGSVNYSSDDGDIENIRQSIGQSIGRPGCPSEPRVYHHPLYRPGFPHSQRQERRAGDRKRSPGV
jgi:hypothetical protein